MQTPWIDFAKTYIGVEEIAGPAANPRIIEMAEDIGCTWYRSDETPWCALFANFVLHKCDYQGTGSLLAADFLHWGVPVQPQYGSLLLFSYEASRRVQHVGFHVGETPTHYQVLGGNQRNSVCVSPFAKSQLVAARWPR